MNEYRTDRSSGRAYNDRWGNPLSVVYACQIAPRYDLYNNHIYVGERDKDTYVNRDAPGTTVAEQTELRLSRMLFGGRDYMMQQCKSLYGRSRTLYLAVAAVGPKLRDPLVDHGPSPDDVAVMRQLWKQAREMAMVGRNPGPDGIAGSEDDFDDPIEWKNAWTELSWSNPPWSGVLIEDKEVDGVEYTTLITSPADIR